MELRELNLALPTVAVLQSMRCLRGHLEGEHWRGGCPYHMSRSPKSRSLAVNLEMRKFFCHKCRAHGDLIDLYAHVHAQTLHQAALELRQRFLDCRNKDDGTEGTASGPTRSEGGGAPGP